MSGPNALNTTTTTTTDDYNDHSTSFRLPFDLEGYNYDYVQEEKNLTLTEKRWYDDDLFMPLCVLYSLTFFFGVAGNLLVIVSHVTNSKRRTTTSSFLVGLAVSDILFLIVCTPHDLIFRMETDLEGLRLLCKMGWYVEMVTTSGSALSLVAVSVERYVVIVHPMRSRAWCRSSRISKIMVAIWCIAVIISLPLLYLQDTRRILYYNEVKYVVVVPCADVNATSFGRKSFTWFQLWSIFLLPMFSMFFCYAVVIRVLWKSTKQLNQLTGERGGDKSESRNANRGRQGPALAQAVTSTSDVTWFAEGRSERRTTTTVKMKMKTCDGNTPGRNAAKNYGDLKESRKQVIKMLIVIILLFFILVGPKWCCNLLKRYRIEAMTSEQAFVVGVVLNFLPFLHTCTNPIIYGFLSTSFRHGLRLALSQMNARLGTGVCCRLCRRRSTTGSRGRQDNERVARRCANEPASESATNQVSGLCEAWCNHDDVITAATTVNSARPLLGNENKIQ